MRSPVFVLSVVASSILVSTAQAQSPLIQQVVDSVNIDSMVWHVQRLSGEVPVNVGNGDQTISSRYQSNAGNALAGMWLQQQFTGLGLTAQVQIFGVSGANIIAEKPGITHPERTVVICAHYDDMPGGPVDAPGADDNGSGVCAVLEAARIMAGHSFGNTIVFALWDEEEQGSIGSAYYASVAGGNNDQIAAVVNMDAIGYDGNGDGVLRIYTGPVANSEAIKDSALMVNTTYGLDLPITVDDPGSTFSDHASFWAQGYGAIMVGEDHTNDLNPNYHSPTDLPQYLDLGYWHGLAGLAIGTAAVMAMPEGGTGIIGQEAFLPLIYPDPAADELTLRWPPGPERSEIVVVTDVWGRTVRRVDLEGTWSAANVTHLDIRELPAGAYVLHCGNGPSRWSVRFIRMP